MRAICKVPPTPAVLFGGCPVSFYDIVGMGLCEIIEAVCSDETFFLPGRYHLG